jgi:hypothetical protein
MSMRMRWLSLSILVLGGAAQAQRPPQPSGSNEIVVQGTRDRDRQVEQFVDALTKAPVGGQLARFDSEVCPAALGLPDYQNQAIVERIRKVAGAAGMRVAKAGCHPNVLLIVAGDKADFMKALYAKRPDFFVDQYGWPRHLKIDSEPASAWQVEGLLDANGLPVAEAVSGARPMGYRMVVSTDSSRLRPSSRPYFAAGFVVVEINALAGITTTQLADYAAMRIFTASDPEQIKKSSAPTILKLLDTPMGGAAPITLTAWDLSVLKGLYSSEARQFANRQRSQIRRSVRRDLAQKAPVPQH